MKYATKKSIKRKIIGELELKIGILIVQEEALILKLENQCIIK